MMKIAILFLLFLLCFNVCFASTERMTFNIEWRGIKVAETTFTHQHIAAINHLSITARSSTLAGLAFSFDNLYQIVAIPQFLPIEYSKDIKQKNIREKSSVYYDRSHLTATYTDTITDTTFTYTINGDTRDFFSALYFLRESDLKQNTSFYIDNAFKQSIINTRFIQSERLRTSIGNIQTNKVEVTFRQFEQSHSRPSDILTNNLVRDENKLYFWFSDDERRIPVKAQFLGRQNVSWVIKSYERI